MYIFRSETRELDDEARCQTQGSYIRLSEGITHYELGNAAGGETVVLVHGFSVPYFIFDPTFEFLSCQGFRVLRYDLFGRGYSDRPDGNYNIERFVKQLADLLDALSIQAPVSLAGLSMGGPITAGFTARFPERVNKLILIDPAGARPILLARLLKAAAAPGIGEAILNLAGDGGIAGKVFSAIFSRELVGHFRLKYLEQTRYRGFRNAILSTIRNDMLGSFIDTYRMAGLLDKPVLLIWGRHDTTVPLRHSDDLRAAMPTVEFHIIEDSSHIPHYQNPAETNALLLEFLRKK
jgi:pimeloyl-ACP methyl ester carboxylesterase